MKKLFLTAIACMVCLTAGAAECVLSVNMAGGNINDALTGPVQGSALLGGKPVLAAFWFNHPYCNANAVAGLRDQYGDAVDGVTVTTSGKNNYTTGLAGDNLFYSYLDDGETLTLSIGGLTSAKGFGSTCTVYVYMSTDSTNRMFYAPAVNGTRYTYADGATTAGTTDWGSSNPGADSNDANFGRAIVGTNYLKIDNVAIGIDGNVTVTSGCIDHLIQRGGIAAVQVGVDRQATAMREVVLSVNFSGGNASDAETGPVTGTAGAVAVAGMYWNNVPTHVTTGRANLVWDDGTVRDGVTLDTTTANNWTTGQNPGASNLFYSYLDDTDVSATVSGLTAANGFPATCTVYVYMSTDSTAHRFYPPKVNDVQYTYWNGAAVQGTGTWGSSDDSRSGIAVAGGNYLKIENVPISNGSVKVISGRYNADVDRGGIAAIQLVFNVEAEPILPFFGNLESSGTFSGATWTPPRSDDAWGFSKSHNAYLCVADAGATTVTLDEQIALKKIALVGEGDLTLAWTSGALLDIPVIDFSDHAGRQRLAADPGAKRIIAGAATYLPDGGTATVEIPARGKAVLDGVTWNGTINNTNGGSVSVTNVSSYAFAGVDAWCGNVFLDAGARLTLRAVGGNKKYTVQGAQDGSSALFLTSDRSWGLGTGTSFRNLRLVTPADVEFWLEKTSAVDHSVDLELRGKLHLGDVNTQDDFTFLIGGLSGTGNIQKEGAGAVLLKVDVSRGDFTYSGNIANVDLWAQGGNTLTLNGACASSLVAESADAVIAGSIKGITNMGRKVVFTGTGASTEDISVGGWGSFVLDTAAGQAARDIFVTEGYLVVGTNANTTVGNVTFAWSGNVIRAEIDAVTGKSGRLHVTGMVDLTGVSGACDGLSSSLQNVLLMTAAGGFTNVDETPDAARCKLFTESHLGVPALYYGKRPGLVVVVR